MTTIQLSPFTSHPSSSRSATVVLISFWSILLLLQPGCGGNTEPPADSTQTDATENSISADVASVNENEQASAPASEKRQAVNESTSPEVRTASPDRSAEATHAGSQASNPTSASSQPALPPNDSRNTSPVTPSTDEQSQPDAAAALEKRLMALEIPPAWINTVESKWDTARPWKEARLEIRRLLGKGDENSRREGIRLMWDYLQKDDIGDGHEYGMYLFLGNEPLWAVHVFREWLARDEHSYPPYFGVRSLAALYIHFGLFQEAEDVLRHGMTFTSPDPRWNEVRSAELHDSLGDVYAAWRKTEQARASYQEAIRRYPLGKPPYGRHLLPRKAKKVQAKLDLLSIASLDNASLRDGRYTETTLGYSGDIQLAVEIKEGRLASVTVVKHEEKIDQNACVLIPQRMTAESSLQVDGISGATVTKDAIVSGTLEALQKAGLK